MSHVFLFDDKRTWYAANWAGRHLVYLILQFLPQAGNEHLTECLRHVEDFPGCNVDLSCLDSKELNTLRTAANRTLAALKQAGPNSELFRDPAFFPGFVTGFEEFIQILGDKITGLNERPV